MNYRDSNLAMPWRALLGYLSFRTTLNGVLLDVFTSMIFPSGARFAQFLAGVWN